MRTPTSVLDSSHPSFLSSVKPRGYCGTVTMWAEPVCILFFFVDRRNNQPKRQNIQLLIQIDFVAVSGK